MMRLSTVLLLAALLAAPAVVLAGKGCDDDMGADAKGALLGHQASCASVPLKLRRSIPDRIS